MSGLPTKPEPVQLVRAPGPESAELWTSRRTSQRGPIVRHELLNTSICEFVCDLKALPRNFKVQFFVVDGAQGFAAGINSSVVEILVRHWEGPRGPFALHLRRNSGQFNTQRKRRQQVIDVAYAGGQNVHVTVAVPVHVLDVLNEIHAVLAVIIKPAYKR